MKAGTDAVMDLSTGEISGPCGKRSLENLRSGGSVPIYEALVKSFRSRGAEKMEPEEMLDAIRLHGKTASASSPSLRCLLWQRWNAWRRSRAFAE